MPCSVRAIAHYIFMLNDDAPLPLDGIDRVGTDWRFEMGSRGLWLLYRPVILDFG